MFDYNKLESPVVIDGAELLEQVCPVSSLTGNRMSLYEAMQMLGNEKLSRAIDALLPEVPAILSDSRLSDDDKVSMLESRLDCGSSSENARMRESLAKVVSDFKDVYDKSLNAPDTSIKFTDQDANVESNE